MVTTSPNNRLRSWRQAHRLSQGELARQLREAGERLGVNVEASKRTVQRWESGQSRSCQAAYARVLEEVTGQSYESLGFSTRVEDDNHGGYDLTFASNDGIAEPVADTSAQPNGTFSGIWLSRYEYVSSGRGATYTGLHYVLLLQHGSRLTVQSLPGASSTPGSELTMTLDIDRTIVTGTWLEHTSPTGYYQGATYHGAIQLLLEPTGRRIAGKWIGFGKRFEINSGPWELTLQDTSTAKATVSKYNRQPPTE